MTARSAVDSPAVAARFADTAGVDSDDSAASALERAFQRGRAAWPGVELDPARYREHLQRLLAADAAPEGDWAAGLASLHTDDLYLACACLHGLAGAHRAFERAFAERAPAMLGHMHLTPHQVDEVWQLARQRLFTAIDGALPRIAAYGGRAPLSAWVRTALVRVALNLLDAERRHPLVEREVDDEVLAERLARLAPGRGEAQAHADPELRFVKQRDRAAVQAAFVAALSALRPDQRNLLRLHHVDGLTLAEIGSLAGVHKATISRRLAQTEAELADRIRQSLSTSLSLPEAEVQSLIALVISQLELSLAGLLPRVEAP